MGDHTAGHHDSVVCARCGLFCGLRLSDGVKPLGSTELFADKFCGLLV
jgi:hypothetical protein